MLSSSPSSIERGTLDDAGPERRAMRMCPIEDEPLNHRPILRERKKKKSYSRLFRVCDTMKTTRDRFNQIGAQQQRVSVSAFSRVSNSSSIIRRMAKDSSQRSLYCWYYCRGAFRLKAAPISVDEDLCASCQSKRDMHYTIVVVV